MQWLVDIAAKDIMRNIDDVDLKVRMKGKRAGKFRVKQMNQWYYY